MSRHTESISPSVLGPSFSGTPHLIKLILCFNVVCTCVYMMSSLLSETGKKLFHLRFFSAVVFEKNASTDK